MVYQWFYQFYLWLWFYGYGFIYGYGFLFMVMVLSILDPSDAFLLFQNNRIFFLF